MERRGRLPDDAVARVKAIPAPDVAAWLDLTPARERHKYACFWPKCSSSDALHAYADGFRCYSCHQSGDVIEATMQRRGLDFRGAVDALASQFGVFLPESGGQGVRFTPPVGYKQESPRPRPVGGRDPARAASPEREAVYAALWRCCTLTPTGRAYLRERMGADVAGIEAEFRSVEGREEWKAILTALQGEFPAAVIQDAVGTREDGKLWLPLKGRAPVLVIPYRREGRVIGLRFRKLRPTTNKKFRYLDFQKDDDGHHRAPLWPYRADDLCGAGDPRPLHIVEGELNAATLAGYSRRYRVIGVPGVARWNDDWTPYLRGIPRIVLWYDADTAGDGAVDRLASAFQTAFGKRWLEERVQRQPMQGGDCNDLHRRGLLADYLAAYPIEGTPRA